MRQIDVCGFHFDMELRTGLRGTVQNLETQLNGLAMCAKVEAGVRCLESRVSFGGSSVG